MGEHPLREITLAGRSGVHIFPMKMVPPFHLLCTTKGRSWAVGMKTTWFPVRHNHTKWKCRRHFHI